ncbi:MepB family protein [Leucobacter sp. G161]|uniref:MepB family protein n=1 Tax=Leucobacter sp. G161 TaxID=663704 RepID=UPI00073B9531|nr:MepB family protein [Leucobacter sp. G161]KUF07131.1 hypothetical protein AUL38_02210 [Leucobacter sp. G161]
MRFSSFERFQLHDGNGRAVAGPWGEEESSSYESGTVSLDGEVWRIRTARVTPTKPGAFVAGWERGARGETRPFPRVGSVVGLMVFVTEGERFGVFRFTQDMLADLGVVRSGSSPGKRGFRVYPGWSGGLNAQAVRAQRAQAPAFEQLA